MPLFLSQRDHQSQERMDDPNCDVAKLQNTYAQFRKVNAIVSRWNVVYKQKIRPHLNRRRQFSFLDVGFGGGDIPIQLAQWLLNDGINFTITAIDPDPRAIKYVRKLNYPSELEFLQCELSELDPAKQQFDFVLSNHLLHHLKNEELPKILQQAKALSSISVIFNDLQRSDWAYLFFNLLSRLLFRQSFITEDGLTSIKRSYTPKELTSAIPEFWTVESLFPSRLLLMYRHE